MTALTVAAAMTNGGGSGEGAWGEKEGGAAPDNLMLIILSMGVLSHVLFASSLTKKMTRVTKTMEESSSDQTNVKCRNPQFKAT